MINRSTIKYNLKKTLPKPIFSVILFAWHKILLHLVEIVDTIRAKKFTSYHAVTLKHKEKTFSLFISPNNGFIDKYIFLYGVYEPFMLDIFAEHLQEGMTFIDIGANIGEHSMYAATLVGEKGSVYSFEPIPFIYKQLKDSISINHFDKIIHAKNIALGEHNRTDTLYISRKNIGGSSLVNQEEGTETITVQIKNGDDELNSIPLINMIKIDVEGYEYEVLSGIKNTLLKHSPKIILEFSGDFYIKQEKENGQKILSLLRECGYTFFDIEDDMKKINDDKYFLSRFENKVKQTNLLCLHEK